MWESIRVILIYLQVSLAILQVIVINRFNITAWEFFILVLNIKLFKYVVVLIYFAKMELFLIR